MFDSLTTHPYSTNSRLHAQVVAPSVSLSALSTGLERSEFIAMFQPSVSAVTGRVVAIEAMLRWNHPERGPLAPFEFLCEADQFGLLDQLAIELIDQAAFAAATWRNSFNIECACGLASAPILISLSGARLRTPAAWEHIDSYNKVADVRSGQLVLRDFNRPSALRKIDFADTDDSRSSLTALMGCHTIMEDVDVIGVSNLLHWYIAIEHQVRSVQGDFICPPIRSEGLVAALSSWRLNFETLTAASQFSNLD